MRLVHKRIVIPFNNIDNEPGVFFVSLADGTFLKYFTFGESHEDSFMSDYTTSYNGHANFFNGVFYDNGLFWSGMWSVTARDDITEPVTVAYRVAYSYDPAGDYFAY